MLRWIFEAGIIGILLLTAIAWLAVMFSGFGTRGVAFIDDVGVMIASSVAILFFGLVLLFLWSLPFMWLDVI